MHYMTMWLDTTPRNISDKPFYTPKILHNTACEKMETFPLTYSALHINKIKLCVICTCAGAILCLHEYRDKAKTCDNM